MKTINLLTKSVLLLSILLITYSCDKNEEDELTQESIQEIGISEEEWTGEIANPSSKNLISSVSGSNFRRFYLDVNFDRFADLVAIKTRSTGTRSTEIHVLDGKSGFTKFIIQTGTALHETGSNFDFLVGLTPRGGLTMYAIKKSNTGSRSTEVHVISGRNGYNRFFRQSVTPLPETNRSYSFRLVGGLDQYLHHIQVFRSGVKSGLLDARTSYRTFF
ncbi:hypothetical protein D1816_10330 [Aquimarina sp. AD10]|uniref:Lipoprotein n=1 Tax=Aquimarina aggregata TaxID=1642818 RepID=A0A162FCG9_9FLAO|nr:MULTISPECIES: hypothetical protein [Aquimarina]AXT60726.1 hypothetical protein D1816_10330 [Aquimarina sp. AD10]KZS41216.1 hypothetical protein AWE51_22690 [Aquimarina aggregata]RKM95753.1 hypothetical protein D7033_16355 [Aquimarina sp. AD10]